MVDKEMFGTDALSRKDCLPQLLGAELAFVLQLSDPSRMPSAERATLTNVGPTPVTDECKDEEAQPHSPIWDNSGCPSHP